MAQLENFASSLTDVDEVVYNGVVHFKGQKENLIINASQAGCSVKGSVSTLLNGHNMNPASWGDLKIYLEALQDLTPYRFEDAYVNRIDLTNDFRTTYAPESYYPYLDRCGKLQRRVFHNTLYFGSWKNQMSVAIYDKRKHGIVKDYPILFDGQSMRGEVRLNKRSHIQTFGLHELSDLLNPRVQKALSERWFNVMDSVQLINPSSIASGAVKTAKNVLEAFATEHSEEYLKFVEEMHTRGELSKEWNYRRARQCIDEYKANYYSEPSDHVNEFKQHITAAYTNNLNLIYSSAAQACA